MRRRNFVKGIIGLAASLLLVAACAQQPEPMRRVGVLMNRAADDSEGQAFLAAFRQSMQQLGWISRNVWIDIRMGRERCRPRSQILSGIGRTRAGRYLGRWRPQRAASQHVIARDSDRVQQSSDPVGAGFVDTLARPGGNVTGFMNFEYSLSVKWLELLKQMVPPLTRVGVLRDSGHSLPGSASSVLFAPQDRRSVLM